MTRKKSGLRKGAALSAAAGVAALAMLAYWWISPAAELVVPLTDVPDRLISVPTGANRYKFPLRNRWLDAKGAAALREGDAGSAELLYRRSLETLPENPRALAGLAAALSAQGKVAEADQALSRAVLTEPALIGALAPALGRRFYRRAHGLLSEGRTEEARADLERAAALDPQNALAQVELASLEILAQRWTACVDRLNFALSLSPGLPEALTNRGACLSALKRHKEALADLDSAIASGRGGAEALATRAGVHLWLKNPAAALADAEAAAALDERMRPQLADVINMAKRQSRK